MRFDWGNFFSLCLILSLVVGLNLVWNQHQLAQINTGALPYGDSVMSAPTVSDLTNPWANWQRPPGPPKVGIQIGHWQNDQLPEELARLRGNTGATGRGLSEAEINLKIGLELEKLLEESGVEVDLIPSTVPPRYWADVFIAIHADGSTDPYKSGYKFAGPWRDLTGNSNRLVQILSQEYQTQTNLNFDPNITRNMRGYYAFSWWRFEHSIHPMTTAVIAETGFLTNANDQELIIDNPQLVATALNRGILRFLQSQSLL